MSYNEIDIEFTGKRRPLLRAALVLALGLCACAVVAVAALAAPASDEDVAKSLQMAPLASAEAAHARAASPQTHDIHLSDGDVQYIKWIITRYVGHDCGTTDDDIRNCQAALWGRNLIVQLDSEVEADRVAKTAAAKPAK